METTENRGLALVTDRTPDTIADALDLSTRLDALEQWASDRKASVREWVRERAETRREQDGAAPTWRMDDGTVLLTDPDPRPRMTDPELFGRWYVEEVLERDPDEDYVDGEHWLEYDERVVRRAVASVRSQDLLAFLDGFRGDLTEAADRLVDRVEVNEDWLLSETLLTDLLDGKTHALGENSPRLVVDGHALEVVDTQTGEVVPGTAVSAPSARTVQIRPSKTTKARTRQDLDLLLGEATLPE